MDKVLEVRHTDYRKTEYRSHGLPSFTVGFDWDLIDEDFYAVLKDMLRLGVKYLGGCGAESDEQIKKFVIDNYIAHRIKKNYRDYMIGAEATPADGLASRLGRKARRLVGTAAALSTPGKVARFREMIGLYGLTTSLDMLVIDPDFQCNHMALTAPNSPHAGFVQMIYKTLEAHPEPL